MKRNRMIMIFVLLFCILFTGSAIAGPNNTPTSVPEPAGILAFLGTAVAGIAAIKSRLKK
jgi:hypothetical protein